MQCVCVFPPVPCLTTKGRASTRAPRGVRVPWVPSGAASGGGVRKNGRRGRGTTIEVDPVYVTKRGKEADSQKNKGTRKHGGSSDFFFFKFDFLGEGGREDQG